MSRCKKGIVKIHIVLLGIFFLNTFFLVAQEDEGSISKASIHYGFSSSDFKNDARYVPAEPSFDLTSYLTESLGNIYPEGEKGKDFSRVNIIMDINDEGKMTNVIYQLSEDHWHPKELEKLNQVVVEMADWVPSRKKSKSVDSKILLSFTIQTSYSILEKHLEALRQRELEIYDRLPDTELVEKEVKIIIEANGEVHFSNEFNAKLKINHPQETQDILNKAIQNLPKQAIGSSNKSKEHVVELLFKKVRDPNVSQERLDSINMLMESGDKFFKDVDEEASFPGGKSALITYLKKGTRNAKKLVSLRYLKAGKKVYIGVAYAVTREGKISSARIVRGKEKLTSNGRERIVKMFDEMPEWTPATKLGVPVNKKYFQKIALII